MGLNDVFVARLHGQPVVVSGSYAGTVAVWDLDGRVDEVIELDSAIWAVA
jgi:hypothetical protein